MEKFWFFILLSAQNTLGANILYISAVPSPSHHIWNRALAFGLAEKGHNVTLVGPDKDKSYPENLTHILLEGLYEDFHDTFNQFDMSELTPTQIITGFIDMCIGVCRSIIKSQGLQELLNYPSDFKFDVIVMDVTLGSCLYSIIHKFNYPPTVAVTPFLLPPYVAYNFGNHLYPTYQPWYGLPYNTNMSFFERFWNFLATYGEVFARNIKLFELERQEAKKVFGDDIPPMEEIERHVSLVLTNTDPLLDYAKPLAPNFIAVGGLHTRKPKPVSKDLQSLLDNAKNGVVVFSLGSNIRSDKLDSKTQKALLDAFAQIPQTVIWKFESNIENLPKNVIVKKWLPQNDILGHHNVRLFIGHGGALSTQEALYHGVPMICVPFFMDQIVNTRNVVDRQLGIFLDYRSITTEYVLEKLREILGNPLYSKNMKKVSIIYRDRKETPLERGIFWIEYTMRHGGADFLSTPARNLPLYKSSGLDIISFLVLVFALIVLAIYKCIKIVIKVCTNGVSGGKIKVN